MARTRRKFARLDLSAGYATRVSVFATWRQTTERLATLTRHKPSRGDTPQPILLTTSYRRGGSSHEVAIFVFPDSQSSDPQSDQPEIHATLRYRMRTERPARRRSVTEEGLLCLFSELGEPEDVWGLVEFEVDSINRDSLWFPLPTQLGSELDSNKLFEISSVRGAKLDSRDPSNVEYQFSLTHFGNGEASASIFVDLEQFGPDSARAALNRAQKFLDDLVITHHHDVGGNDDD